MCKVLEAAYLPPISSTTQDKKDQHPPTPISYCNYLGAEHAAKNSGNLCKNSIVTTATPSGQCYTINARGDFGRVTSVGEKRGLSIAIDQGNSKKNTRSFKEADVTQIWVLLSIAISQTVEKVEKVLPNLYEKWTDFAPMNGRVTVLALYSFFYSQERLSCHSWWHIL